MIEIKNTEISGWKASLRGMRNPLNSWSKSDSTFDNGNVVLGESDLKLCKNLIKAGPSDRKFMRMIHVSADVNAPLYLFKEMDTYKIATVSNSCSTMHKIHSRDLTLEDFSYDHLDEDDIDHLKDTIARINKNRVLYKETHDKKYWWKMIQLLPSSYNQLRTFDLNYETLMSIYKQRKNHKLDEWHVFCKWIEDLPYMKEFIQASDQS